MPVIQKCSYYYCVENIVKFGRYRSLTETELSSLVLHVVGYINCLIFMVF